MEQAREPLGHRVVAQPAWGICMFKCVYMCVCVCMSMSVGMHVSVCPCVCPCCVCIYLGPCVCLCVLGLDKDRALGAPCKVLKGTDEGGIW